MSTGRRKDHPTDKRVAAVRAKVREERARLSELESSGISTDLKKLIRCPSSLLTEVEAYLAVENGKRSDGEMARWLRFVGGILEHAIEHRKCIEGYIKKFGPDARVVGD